MAYKDNQQEPALPANGLPRRESVNHLPKFFRTDFNKKFLNATLDQMVQPGVVEKINGFYGRKNAKAYVANDIYVDDISKDRVDYQLEPVSVIKDNLNNVEFYANYNDYINFVKIRNGNYKNHDVLNQQECYAWNPHIDFDKFINFREYYWLPTGPQTVTVIGQSNQIQSEYKVRLKDNDNNLTYLFTPDGLTDNPSITLYRGQTYRFDINTPSYPFAFVSKISYTPGKDLEEDIYNTSLIYNNNQKKFDRQGIEIDDIWISDGIIEFTVPDNAPDNIFYISKDDVNLSGIIKIFDIDENTFIDVEKEIIGKKSYTTSQGWALSNGMKVEFAGNVYPESYAEGEYYIEGVGDSIELINTNDLKLSSLFVDDLEIPFDNDGFDNYPFSEALGYASDKDYITINRASIDGNLWSKYNRWFHIDVIEKSLELNSLPISVDQNSRAKRPIIEFEKGLKLYNFGTKAKTDVDLVDEITTDVFSNVEGAIGYNIDGVDLTEGMRVIFLADNDLLVKGKIFKVKFLTINDRLQITLVDEPDTEPKLNETVLVRNGQKYKSKSLFYTGTEWNLCQEKNNVNQAPLFDLYDDNDINLKDNLTYQFSQFSGNKLFSYKEGDGPVDNELGLRLQYQNLINSGDILFTCDLLSESFTFTNANNLLESKNTDVAFIRKYSDIDTYVTENSWIKTHKLSEQSVINQFVLEESFVNNFPINWYEDEIIDVNFLWIRIYRNGVLQEKNKNFEILSDVNQQLYIEFITTINVGDNIIVKTRYSAEKNDVGYYEIPASLERNPLNQNLLQFTLGELIDHGFTIIEEINNFSGTFPGKNNLRDLGKLAPYGRKFLKHSSPLNLSVYNFLDKDSNILSAIQYSKEEYSKFKRRFIEIADNLGFDGPIKDHVDRVIADFVVDKNDTQPFFYTDMVPYAGSVVNNDIIVDVDQEYYALSERFSLDIPSNKAVNIYRNGEQLIHGKDYVFNDEGFVQIFGFKKVNDFIEVYEYENTNGSFIPPTPTKLGLYPSYQPEIYIDTTYFIEQNAEHNGPYKIYAYEKNEPNDNDKFGWFYPIYLTAEDATEADILYNGTGEFSIHRFVGLNRPFYMPISNANVGAQDNINYLEWEEGILVIQGHDGSLTSAFKDFKDQLIFELEKRIYNNLKVKYDDTMFDVKEVVPSFYRHTGIKRQNFDNVLINDFISFTRFINQDYSTHQYFNITNSFTYNYSGSRLSNNEFAPGWWRQIFKYVYDTDRPHTHPWEMLGFTIKPAWWDDEYGEFPYTSDNLIMWEDLEKGIIRQPNFKIDKRFLRPGLQNFKPVDNKGNLLSPSKAGLINYYSRTNIKKSFVFGDGSPVESIWRRSSDFVFSLIKSILLNKAGYAFATGFDRLNQVRNIAGQIVYKTTKNHITLENINAPYIDNDNFYTSGLINYIAEYQNGIFQNRYTNYVDKLKSVNNQIAFQVGGFTDKDKWKLILDSRTPLNEGNVFVPAENYSIFLHTSYPAEEFVYSGVVIEKSLAGWTISGYNDSYTKFKYFPPILRDADTIINVGGVSKEYLVWEPDKTYAIDAIVKVGSNTFYRCKQTHVSGENFDISKFVSLPRLPIIGGVNAKIRKQFNKTVSELSYGTSLASVQDVTDFLLGYGKWLESVGFTFDRFVESQYEVADWNLAVKQFLFWTTQNWDAGSLITLSPGADKVNFASKYGTVGNVIDTSVKYSIFKADGTVIKPRNINFVRDNNNNFYAQTNNNDGIYFIKIPVVYKEHVVLIDNVTEFNDIIFDLAPGYRQERIRVLGYRTNNWTGGLDIPGFFYDDVKISKWEQWKKYNIGDIVQYKEFNYVATINVDPADEFNYTNWKLLNTQVSSNLFSNFDYKIEQFKDFYDLDSDNLDLNQQKLAQHLIGYQKRKYLENIINNDVSQYKFYQGYIQEKGTKNSLTKLFDVLASAEKDSLEFYEEYAVKQGNYGAVRNFNEFDFILDEENFKLSPQPILLTNNITGQETDLIYRIPESQVLSKDIGYQHRPFPTIDTEKFQYRHAGYVSENDVDKIVSQYSKLKDLPLQSYKENELIWIGNYNADWTVVTYKRYDYKFKQLALVDNKQIDLYFDVTIEKDFKVGDFVGLQNVSKLAAVGLDSTVVSIETDSELSGIFEIVKVELDILSLGVTVDNASVITLISTSQLEGDATGIITRFVPVRVPDLESMSNLVNSTLQIGNKVWVDNDNTNSWKVFQLENNFVYNSQINNPNDTSMTFGYMIKTNHRNTVMVVGDPSDNDGKVYVYTRPSVSTEYKLLQILEPDVPDAENLLYENSDNQEGFVYLLTKDNVNNIRRIFKNGIVIDSSTYTKNESENKITFSFQILQDDIVFVNYNTHAIPYEFGKSVAIDDSGNYIMVGAPSASRLKTKIKGLYDSQINYFADDIVYTDDNNFKSYFKANVDIRPAADASLFSSFYNYGQFIKDNGLDTDESIEYPMLFTGSYDEREILTDHIIIRLPEQIFSGVKVNDQIKLHWNDISNINQTQISLTSRQPFDGEYDIINKDFINNLHIVQHKFTDILKIQGARFIPTVGSDISSEYAIGKIVNVIQVEGTNDILLYCNDRVGNFDEFGTLKVGVLVLGDYIVTLSSSQFSQLSTVYGGFISIPTPGYLITAKRNDSGRGLVITDIITEQNPTSLNVYYNLLDYSSPIIKSLSYIDFNLQANGDYNPTNKLLQYYVINIPKNLDTNNSFQLFVNDFEKTVKILKVRSTRFVNVLPDVLAGETLKQKITGATAIVFSSEVTISPDTINSPNPVYLIQVQFVKSGPTGLFFNFVDELVGSISGETFTRPIQEPVKQELLRIEALGLTDPYDENNNTINNVSFFDTWDGFIVYDENRVDANGLPFVPYSKYYQDESLLTAIDSNGNERVGQTIRELSSSGIPTNNTAEVMFVQRISNNRLVVWINNIQGSWISASAEPGTVQLQMDAHPTGVDILGRLNIYNFDRSFGIAHDFSSYQENDLKFGVIFNQYPIPIQIDPVLGTQINTLDNVEYWIYTQSNILGLPKQAISPENGSIYWQRIYNLQVDPNGTESEFDNEGLVYIFKKTGRSYELIQRLLGPDRQDNYKFGTNIKLIGNLISARSYILAENPKRIYFVNNGTYYDNTYNWEYAANKKFKGVFNSDFTYFTGDIVFVPRNITEDVFDTNLGKFDGTLFEAITNGRASVVDLQNGINTSYWKLADNLIDYVGFIPNTIGSIQIDSADISTLDSLNLTNFGIDFDLSANGDVLVVFLQYENAKNELGIYRNDNGYYRWMQNIEAENENTDFGVSFALSANGDELWIGAPLTSISKVNQGKVYYYKLVDQTFVLQQIIASPYDEIEESFGISIKENNGILVIGSANANFYADTTFDNDTTIFDSKLTTFQYAKDDKGVLFVFEKINEFFVYADYVNYDNPYANNFRYGSNIVFNNKILYVADMDYKNDSNSLGYIQTYHTTGKFYSVLRSKKLPVDTTKIKKITLYNRKTNNLIKVLDYVDVLQGKIPGPAEQNIDFKLYFDPANYNTVNDNNLDVIYNVNIPWTTDYVGMVLWDLNNAKFYYPHLNDISFSVNRWQKVFIDNSIDLYEWVESSILPDQWDEISETTEGFALGISGKSKYGNNAYVEETVLNQTTNTLEKRYYFWVKDKKDIPNKDGRTISVHKIQNLIKDPINQGYEFVSLISADQFAVYNCLDYLNDDDVAISFQIFNDTNTTANLHSQYKLISVGLDNSKIPNFLEQKWIDSLVGFDLATRAVPDITVPEKYRYGMLNEPRQGLFVNRQQALKEYIERVNRVLEKNLIVDSKNLQNLYKVDDYPTDASNEYDIKIQTYAEIEDYGIAKAEQAQAVLEVIDGKIVNVTITNPGRGYQVAPTYNIIDKGTGAEIQFQINSIGSVISANIIQAGKNYNQAAKIEIRKFTVLVEYDENLNNKWSLYERNYQANSWTRIKSQGFNTKLYWNFIDWYAEGYNASTRVTHLIDFSYQLEGLNANIGDIVKIKSIGTGGWLLLYKIDNQENVDYSINYETVGRENGTIAFSNLLYENKNFDLQSFDINFYDILPTDEIRVIANAIKDDIFIDDLAIEYNNLFFAQIRYILSEQQNVDWIFKSSFIRIKHNVGELRQDITFNNDNLPSYEEYVKEVKPYKANIREYISAYDKLDNNPQLLTDFDLPPAFNFDSNRFLPYSVKAYNEQLYGLSNELQQYPNKNWLDNVGYVVLEVKISDNGYGYVNAPTLSFVGGGGTGAKAEARLGENGKIVSIEMLNNGSGYLSAPTLIIEGETRTDFKAALCSVILGQSLVRSTYTKIKFDRISPALTFKDINGSIKIDEEFEEIVSGSKYIFDLLWPMSLQPKDIQVFVNNEKLLRGGYSFTNVLDTTKTYHRYFGRITLLDPPANYSVVKIKFKKDINLLPAVDRIKYYYKGEVGAFGNDISQLMEGVDYGGVEIKSFAFNIQSSWDNDGYFSSNYDTYDELFEDIISVIGRNLIQVNALDYKIQINWINFAKAVNALIIGDSVEIDNHTLFYSIFNVDQLGNSYPDPLNGNSILNVLDELVNEAIVDENSNLVLDAEGNIQYQLVPKITIRSVEQMQKYGINSVDLNELAANNIDNQIITLFQQLSSSNISALLAETNPVINEVKIVMQQPLVDGQQYNFYLNNVRLDDPIYADDSTAVSNPNAVMQTIIGDGTTTELVVRNYIDDFNTGDIIILRKPTSDGSFIPSDLDYDTLINGGNINYSNAIGVNADDINIDGDNFVTPTTSKSTEENVPGLVQDTLDITVYERSNPGASNIISKNYISDGSTVTYNLDTYPLKEKNIIVKVNNNIVTNYAINSNKTLTFLDAPEVNSRINIIIFDYSGYNVLDVDTIVANGNTNTFLVNARYEEHLQSQISVNGKEENYVCEANSENNIVINFARILDPGDVVRYVIYTNSEQESNAIFSEITIDEFVFDGSTTNFPLSVIPYKQEPAEWFTLVIVNNKLLNPGYTEIFEVSDVREYQLRLYQVPIRALNFEQIRVFLNDSELEYNEQWTFNSAGQYNPALSEDNQQGSLIILRQGVGTVGDTLKVYINANDTDEVQSGGDYKYGYYDDEIYVPTPGILHIYKEMDIGDIIKVYQFSNHDSQRIDWQSFDIDQRTLLSPGKIIGSGINIVTSLIEMYVPFILESNKQYAIFKNGFRVDDLYYGTNSQTNLSAEIQTPFGNGTYFLKFQEIGLSVISGDVIKVEELNAQYTIDADSKNYNEFRQLKNGVIALNYPAVGDQYVWVAKNGVILTPSVDYYLLADMQHIKLVDYLVENDNVQTVHFSNPVQQQKFGWRQFTDILNRTHYNILDGQKNITLKENLNWYDKIIVVENADELPNPDHNSKFPGVIFIQGERIEFKQRYGNVLQHLRRGTLGTGVKKLYTAGTEIYNQSVDTILPYKDETIFVNTIGDGTTKEFALDFIVNSVNEFEVFVGGTRLRKTSLQSYELDTVNRETYGKEGEYISQDSPEGDIILPPEFTVDNNTLIFHEAPKEGVKILIVRKIGLEWTKPGDRLVDTDTPLSRIIRSVEADLPR